MLRERTDLIWIFRSECGEACKQRRRELDSDVKQLRRDARIRDEQMQQLEGELMALRQYKEAHNAEVRLSFILYFHKYQYCTHIISTSEQKFTWQNKENLTNFVKDFCKFSQNSAFYHV